ncbi:MAG: FGGY family carbohydrate kinase, partial [Bacillota bacterium]
MQEVSAVPDLAAVGVTSFGESFVLLDQQGDILMPTMLYTDPRGEAEADFLSERLGEDNINTIAGTAPHPMYSLPKLMWVRNHKPEIFAKI